MLISELAEATDVAIHTIRFYEREGLIDERFFRRSGNRYRNYSPDAVERILIIKQGQAAGYTLTEVRELLKVWDAGELTDAAEATYLRQKIAEITEKIADLERVKAHLAAKLERLAIPQNDATLHG